MEPSDRSARSSDHNIFSRYIDDCDEDHPYFTVPTDQSPTNNPAVSASTTSTNLDDDANRYQLPVRQNLGKLPTRYSPDNGKASKYPIANYVSTEELSEPLKGRVHELSAIHIPTKVTEALKDPEWVLAMK